MSEINDPDERWYGEESAYVETDETFIDDSIPVFDRGRLPAIGSDDLEWD